jgi:hypothetical protein
VSKQKEMMKARYTYHNSVDDHFSFSIEVKIEDTSEQKDFVHESFFEYFNGCPSDDFDEMPSSISPFEKEVWTVAGGLENHYKNCRKLKLKSVNSTNEKEVSSE